MSRTLVTGAGGFIGSHLVQQLVEAGHRVRAFTRYTSSAGLGALDDLPGPVLEEVEVYPGDLRDPDAVLRAASGVDVVFHLGAIVSIPYSYEHPDETLSVNVNGTMNVLRAMRQLGTERGVVVSTSEVYGTAQFVPIDETHPLQPQSPYAASKIAAESLAVSFHRSFATPVTVVRPFNTYGPRQSARAVIPTIVMQALTRDTITLGAVHTWRDLTFAADTARGLMRAAFAARSHEALGRAVNLGSGQAFMIGDLARRVAALVGRDVALVANETRRMRPEASEVLRLQADNALARELFAWEPSTDIDTGLRATVDWIAGHLDRFDTGSYVV